MFEAVFGLKARGGNKGDKKGQMSYTHICQRKEEGKNYENPSFHKYECLHDNEKKRTKKMRKSNNLGGNIHLNNNDTFAASKKRNAIN